MYMNMGVLGEKYPLMDISVMYLCAVCLRNGILSN